MKSLRSSSELEFATQALREGYSLEEIQRFLSINNVDNKSTFKPANTNKVSDNKQQTAPKGATKTSTKGGKGKKADTSKGSKKNTKSKELDFGNVKKGDYFKVVVDNKITRIGKADTVTDNEVKTAEGKIYIRKNCVAINSKTFGKLAKRKDLKKCTVKKSEFNATHYKLAYVANLFNLGKIDEGQFKKALGSANLRSELYKQFKDEVKLSSDDAKKIIAEGKVVAAA